MQIKPVPDKKVWEKFISFHSPQSLFQSWYWGETVIRSRDKKNVFLSRYGLTDSGNNLKGIFQIIKVLARRGTFLHVRHGPVLTDCNSDALKNVIDFLTDLARKEKAAFIRISPLIKPDDILKQIFKKSGFIDSPLQNIDAENCWVLDLDKSEEELLKGMRKTTRYLIRWALKNNVVITKTDDFKNLKDFQSLYDLTSKRHHFIKHTAIREEFEIFASSNQALLFKGYYQNKLLAAAIIIFYQNQAIYHHSASIDQKIPVNYLLQWEVIKEAKKRGLPVYNFWGISPSQKKNHPWNNLTLFKKGFGGREVVYNHCQDLPLNKFSYLATFLVEYIRKTLKGF